MSTAGRSSKRPIAGLLVLQLVLISTVAWSYARLSPEDRGRIAQAVRNAPVAPVADIPRRRPLTVEPLYDDPRVVGDEELAAVLKLVRPRFDRHRLKPNYVEHALRTWGKDASFADPHVMSGPEMVAFLTDHATYARSWDGEVEPLLIERPGGVAIRWGRSRGASVHHDHWLACLSEAGVSIDTPLRTASGRRYTFRDALVQALRDMRLDEREVEWSAMAFGLWIPPHRRWINDEGRLLSFDLLAQRLIRGHSRFGVCSGTHRVYSLALLLRLDEQFHILSPGVRDAVWQHLAYVRDLIRQSQFPDGHWPSNWAEGKRAVDAPIDDPEYRQVIATGHHLEWLAIAPRELHPPHEQIVRAARWVIHNTTSKTEQQIQRTYTFYSHVGNALALWRRTHPALFWSRWLGDHPEFAAELARAAPPQPAEAASDSANDDTADAAENHDH